MLEKIALYRWRRLKPLDITLANQTFKSLVKLGLIQYRTFTSDLPTNPQTIVEVRRVAMQDVQGRLRDAAQCLINTLPSATRTALAPEVAAVLACIVQEEA